MKNMDDKLDALFAEYRAAVPDLDGSADFMPKLWQKIEARGADPLAVLRKFAKVCVTAAVALVVIFVISLARLQVEPVFSATSSTYIDALDAEHASDYVEVADVL
jgi:hypothetical protein